MRMVAKSRTFKKKQSLVTSVETSTEIKTTMICMILVRASRTFPITSGEPFLFVNLSEARALRNSGEWKLACASMDEHGVFCNITAPGQGDGLADCSSHKIFPVVL